MSGDARALAEELVREIRSAAERARDGYLTDEEAAELLRCSAATVRARAAELVGLGARILTLPSEGENKRPRRRWLRSSLLELARTV
jgi:hypothetical protein